MGRVLGAGLVCVCVLGVVVTTAVAQGRGAQGPPTNLQVLPQDTPRPQLTALMRSFTAALGVQCSHCHVGTPQERAKDDLETKAKARNMLKMVMALNGEYLGVPAGEDNKVTCYTCHRGELKPLTAPPPGGGGR